MEWMAAVISALVPSLLCGVILARFNHRQSRKDAVADRCAEARKQESLLLLEMNMANAKLSYAVAMAIKRGKTNGEVEEGIEAYEAARKKYLHFLNTQATEHLHVF